MKIKIYIYVVIATLLVGLVGATYAYFANDIKGYLGIDVSVVTPLQAKLIFEKKDDLEIDINMSNFAANMGNLSASVEVSATLDVEGFYEEEYYVYFYITKNEFIYTTSNPELVLVITDPDGEEITTIENLEYVEIKGVTGFDVTNKEGLYEVMIPKKISTEDGAVKDSWTFELVFINLDTNQYLNAGKKFISEIILNDDIFEKPITNLADKVISLASEEEIVHEEFYYDDWLISAGYRYQGNNPNNYIMFNDELWRIVSVTDKKITSSNSYETVVKIVKAESLTQVIWDNEGNIYSESLLNSELNTDYLYKLNNYDNNGIKEEYRGYIENVSWSAGGGFENFNTGDWLMQEITSTANSNIGLISISDYGYASPESTCPRDKKVITDYNVSGCYDENWLYNGKDYFTITDLKDFNDYVWRISSNGNIGTSSKNSYLDVFPSLHLKSDTESYSGDGSIENPYILA